MDDTYISRGFRSKRQGQVAKNRVPPGQYVTTDFPILSAGPTPQITVADWSFALQLGGSLVLTMSARSAYSEWTVVGPLSAAITGTGISIRFAKTFLPSR